MSQRPRCRLPFATAYMMLVTCNTQGELTALERGLHALNSGMEGKAYAASVGRPEQSVYRELHAAKVAAVIDIDNDLTKHFSQLVEIHAAPAWLRPALVAAMLPSTRPMGEVLVDPARKSDELEIQAPSQRPRTAA